MWGPGLKECIQRAGRVSGEARGAKNGTEREMQRNGRASSDQTKKLGAVCRHQIRRQAGKHSTTSQQPETC